MFLADAQTTAIWVSTAGGIVAAAIGGFFTLRAARERNKVDGRRGAAQRVLEADDDEEARNIAQEAEGDKAAVVMAVLDRQQASWMRRNVECEVARANEKREHKVEVDQLRGEIEGLRAEVVDLRTRLEALSRG